MLPATSQKKSNPEQKNPGKLRSKRKPIREQEREAREIVDEMNEEEPFEFDRIDVIAMIIAGYQVIMPFVLAGAGIMFLSYLLFWVWLR